jgi:hypothetical protein
MTWQAMTSSRGATSANLPRHAKLSILAAGQPPTGETDGQFCMTWHGAMTSLSKSSKTTDALQEILQN